ncbi:MAG TPA: hypothetical protein VL966_19450 [Alphaproteobacteria bacterium]|jgi:hypothetical protein|nr:hypothetical protein [Alphaproteobacteria bacterium]
MISARDIRHALTGAVLLARGERTGVAYFEDTPRDFWRSFWAAAVVAPVWLLLIAIAGPDTDAGPLRVMLAEVVEYALLWTAFPLVLHEILSRSGIDEHFCRYIAVHNWASVIVAPAMLVAIIIGTAVPLDILQLLPILVIISSLVYEWFMAKVMLEVSGATAAGIAAMDFFLGHVINLVVEALLAAPTGTDLGLGQ